MQNFLLPGESEHSLREHTAQQVAHPIDVVDRPALDQHVQRRLLAASVPDVSRNRFLTPLDADEIDEQAVATLISWLSENLNTGDVTHEAYVVQEAFAHGLGDIQRSRAADRAMTSTTKAVIDVDAKLRITERAHSLKESPIVQETGAALSKAGTSVYNAGTKAGQRIGQLFGGK